MKFLNMTTGLLMEVVNMTENETLECDRETVNKNS